MKDDRLRLVLACTGIVVLATVLVAVWLQFRPIRRGLPAKASPGKGAVAEAPTSPSAGTLASNQPPLVPLEISPQRLQSIGVETGEVQWKRVEDAIPTTGNVAVDETKLTYVQVRFSGYLQKVFAAATYDYVRQGQPLFTVYSPELVATEREYLAAKQNQEQLARSTVPGVALGAASLLSAAVERLAQWGIPAREIARLEATGRIQREIEVDSPASGYVIERAAFPNLAVQPETRLYTIADLSTVWVQAQVSQNDLGRIQVGDPATLTVDSYPGRTFDGRVDFVYPQVDLMTRTANVRIIFSNPHLLLKPGMFASVQLKVPMGRHLVIPAAGVLLSGTRQIVFVDRGQGRLEPREVQLGARVGDEFIVLTGLKAHEKIVTSANFLIDSESQLEAALGSFVPPPPGAGASEAINAVRASLEVSFEPSPPRKGSNTVRVRLVDPKGNPISGAQVTATFLMPAMPAMGMAAMRTSIELTPRGNGRYEGSGQLASGGTWQVTILARKNGQILARQQLTVNATGGM
jgi:RND family efflux transporter MFP subunit